MRTFLVWTLRVTISPWNSLPTFLKEPMLAMSLLLAVSSPRPPRPRWRSGSRRRSTTHPFAGRSAAEDGGGRLSCLARNGQRPGEESRSARRCVSGDRGAAVLRPDQAIERPCRPRAEQHPREKTWRTSETSRSRGSAFQAKNRKPWCSERTTSRPDNPCKTATLPTKIVTVGLEAQTRPSAQTKALALPVTRTSLIQHTEIQPLRR